jgi:hypothetical protein
MEKLIAVVVALSLFPNVVFAFNMDEVVDGVCECRKEYFIQSKKMMDAMNKAQSSGDRSKMKAIQSEESAVTDAMTRCFDNLAKKYPEIDKSEKLQEELEAKADEKCPGPEN